MTRKMLLAVLASCCLFAAVLGCGNDAKQRMLSSNNLKQLSLSIIIYHQNKKAWPESLADLKPFIKDYDTIIRNPVTGDNPGYEYIKPPQEPKSNSETVVLYQLRDGNRDESLPVAYLDGSVRPINTKSKYSK